MIQDKNGIRLGDLNKIEVNFNEYCEILRVFHTKIDKTVHSGFIENLMELPKEVIQILLKQHSDD